MGSTSAPRISCFQCEESSSSFDHFRNGWRLRSGEFAQLCPRCASIYEDGKFCETFHSGDDGWRDCESCGKLVHCGCIVSFNAYMLLDFGGIICMECSRINFIQARNRCLPLEIQQGLFGKAVIEPQYRPHSTDTELQQISRNSESVVTPLFEKQLSITDADMKLARLILPKKCAEAFFPDISDPRGLPIKIHDMEGKEWEFIYRYWINAGSKMYILEGLREFMVSKRWQAGDTAIFGICVSIWYWRSLIYILEDSHQPIERFDFLWSNTVTFYRVDPGGILVIGLRKNPVNELVNEKST